MTTAYTCAACITPLETLRNAVVLVENGTVTQVGSRDKIVIPAKARTIDLDNAALAPGFVDIHIHGAAGHDVMEAKPEALAAIERFLFANGTTSYFPTTVTASSDATLRALDRLADAIEDRHPEPDRARPLGIHLEGPFISHNKRGVHPPEYIQPVSIDIFDRFWQTSRGHIKIMTVAPEIPGAEELIREAVGRGVLVSLGHSNASFEEAATAINVGARHATHTFNAMRPMDHRDPGIVGAVLTDPRVTADIIADGVHVDPAMIRLFLAAKGYERALLITDAVSATGMPDGEYQLGGMMVQLRGNECLHKGRLAGSVLTLHRAVQNIMDSNDWPLEKAIRLATLNPAQAAGVSEKKGTISPGSAADFVVLSPSGSLLKTIREL